MMNDWPVRQIKNTALAILAMGVFILGMAVHNYDKDLERKTAEIQTMRGYMDSMSMRLANCKAKNRNLRRQLQKNINWVARALVSETTRPDEMRVIAEVIRNRVETGWRNKHTYKQVILDPKQFSAFNPGRRRAYMYRTMTDSNTPYPEMWKTAKRIAREVITAPRDSLITSRDVLHFHHNWVKPRWSDRLHRVNVLGIDRMTTYRNPRIQVR